MEIKETTDDGVINLRLANNIHNTISLFERNEKIKNTKELLTKEIGELSRSEGGTGYPKIKKILLIDFKRTDSVIDISNVEDDRIFTTKIVNVKVYKKLKTKMKFLLIEDDSNKYKHILDFLAETYPDTSTELRRSYQSGLKEIFSHDYNLVLLDMQLPTFDIKSGEDGYKFRKLAGVDILNEFKKKTEKV